jgi:hypothetical protein
MVRNGNAVLRESKGHFQSLVQRHDQEPFFYELQHGIFHSGANAGIGLGPTASKIVMCQALPQTRQGHAPRRFPVVSKVF